MRIEPVRPVRFRQAPSKDNARLAMADVCHAFEDSLVLDGLSLSIGAGEIICLLGASGCGKTTTLRIAAGLEKPSSGEVWINGHAMLSREGGMIPPEKRGVGFLFQDYALFPHLKVLDNVTFGLRHIPEPDKTRRAHEALEHVGMASYASSWPHTLSGGQQQRVALARALAPNPALLLLDEPFSGLDRYLRDQIRAETLTILKDRGISALMVTHDPEEAMFMADVLALMDKGRIIQSGTPAELYNHPSSAFVARFFCDFNLVKGHVLRGSVETPFGLVDAPYGVEEGSSVEVLIRPEAIRLTSVADGDYPAFVATVIDSRMLGRTSLVYIKAGPAASAERVVAHVRAPGSFLPPAGEVLSISLDRSQTFVFASV
ncbi:ABC transporter ATP-binding protein [Haematospirillum jordaniae]|uniref:ABC transporter n=1 Tax=Haematospirillum jordaniae TaxID=1549855 RepID=A0A143DF69_9PROT|nr:ABC transporter ATP-binding protein [Haematospirillum jordaniae]AMW35229.1 ABC transporter [Haematospirillum jordaniae]